MKGNCAQIENRASESLTHRCAFHIKDPFQMLRINIMPLNKEIKPTLQVNKRGKCFTILNDYVQNRQQPLLEVPFEIAHIPDVDAKDLLKSENSENKTKGND